MDRRTLLQAGLAAPAMLALPPYPTGFAEGARHRALHRPRVSRTLARGLDVPWGIGFLPNGDALVSERDTGRILRVRKHGGWHPVGHVPGVVPNVSLGGEGGLLGLALDPHFARNRWVYAYFSSHSDNRVVRMRYRHGMLGRPHVLLKGIRKSIHHNGGGLAFGPGGRLYISTGDAEISGNAQDPRSLSGKILRINRNGSVPRNNPWHNPVWSRGHRNVEHIAFDGHGQLWASEFGDHRFDELNRIVKGHNYGWPVREGRQRQGRAGHQFTDPFVQWPTETCSPSGLAIAHGWAWLGALEGECVWSVRLRGKNKRNKARHFAHRWGRVRMVAAAPDGSLWVGTSNRDGRASPGPHDDRIFRISL